MFDRFLLEIFLKFLVSAFLLRATAHALVVDASSVHAHRDEWCLTVLVHNASRSKSTEVKSQSRSITSSKCTPQENSLAIGRCFKCNIYRITALGWLKKEEDEQF